MLVWGQKYAVKNENCQFIFLKENYSLDETFLPRMDLFCNTTDTPFHEKCYGQISLSAVFWYECNFGFAEKFGFVLFLNVEVQINEHHVGMT